MNVDNQKLAETLLFFTKLNLFAIPLYTALFFNLRIEALQTLTRDVSFYLMDLIGLAPTLSDITITIQAGAGLWGASIDWDCTGWKSMAAFIALVMATPRSMRSRLTGIAVFLPMIFFVNITRIVFMFAYVSAFGLNHYALLHTTVWSWGLISAVLVFWLLWMKLPLFYVRQAK